MAQHPRPSARLLAALVLVALTTAACGAAQPAGTGPPPLAPGERTDGADPTSSADPTSRADPSDGEAAPPDANAVALAAGSRLATELGAGLDVGTAPLTAEEVATLRADRTDLGAVGAAYLFLMAWRHALATGDEEHLQTLSGPGCSFCAAEARRTGGSPLAAPAEVALVGWRLGEALPDGDYPHHRVHVGVSVVAWEPPTDGEPDARVTHLEDLDMTIALSLTEPGWQVEGVASSPWQG
ncbi:hypothetical protein [Actinotalea sp. C106]|uniref:hypothetical protein n=1 Tax=Actinotalea sp. C106 TaxID=2908644 RepID=UPI0020286D2D|nr:hypothetical protein [Actinotalea sp. C106]